MPGLFNERFAQIKCESKSKSFSVMMSLARIQESSTVPRTSPEEAGPEHSPLGVVTFAGNTEQKARGDCMPILYCTCAASPGMIL